MGNKVMHLLVILGFVACSVACSQETPNAVQHLSEPSEEVKESMGADDESCDTVNQTMC
ncbi:MAG TPA: hypothetical protein VIC26_09315 [Marinagarivorans sp.]